MFARRARIASGDLADNHEKAGENMLGVCLKYTQNNYGSKLQALATVRVFEKMGVEYEIIRYNKKTWRFFLKSIPRFLNWVFINDRYCQVQRALQFRKHPCVKANIDKRNKAFDSFDVFFDKHISGMYCSYEDLKKRCCENYDKVITCSDQLWSPSALGSGFYNLMFVPQQVPKISWASSFGVANIPWYQKGRTAAYLKRIEHISMREERGAEIVKELTGREVPVLMDPVFVFDKAEWETIIPVAEAEWEPYVFCYFLGSNPTHRAAAKRLASELGLKIVTLRHLDCYVDEDEQFGDFAPYDVDPARFLNILRNASFVCTDSFHGTAFSIILQKPFLVFDRYDDRSSNSKNSRIDSVCSLLELQSRRYFDNRPITEAMCSPIDYTAVEKNIEKYRLQTKRYLKEALIEENS